MIILDELPILSWEMYLVACQTAHNGMSWKLSLGTRFKNWVSANKVSAYFNLFLMHLVSCFIYISFLQHVSQWQLFSLEVLLLTLAVQRGPTTLCLVEMLFLQFNPQGCQDSSVACFSIAPSSSASRAIYKVTTYNNQVFITVKQQQ